MASAAALVLVLVLGACGDQTLEVEEAPPALEGTEEADLGEPEPETTVTEEPATGGDGGLAVDLPRAPIGGVPEPVSATLQCAVVNWSGPPDLLEGIRLEITSIGFEPPGVYALSGETCPGSRPPCLPSWLGAAECTVPITWTGEPSEVTGKLFFTGARVTCTAELRDACLAFERDLAAIEPKGIDLLPPPGGGDGATGGEVDVDGGNADADGGEVDADGGSADTDGGSADADGGADAAGGADADADGASG